MKAAVSAITAITEETLVSDYLLTRLEQFGWTPQRDLLLSLTLRTSYHVYYGLGFRFTIPVGYLLTRSFQKHRRLTRPVVAHFLYDAALITISILASRRIAGRSRPERGFRSVQKMEDQVTLRPVAEDDLAFLERLTNDPAATGPHEWHGWSDPGSWRRGWAKAGLLGESGGVLMVVHGAERVGNVSWRKTQTGAACYCWGIGIGLAPDFRGRGYGAAAQRLLARYLFAHTQVNRIQAETEITNLAEQRALENAGFTREGVMRGATFRAGRWHDNVLYSVLRAEVELDADGLIT